MAFTGNCYALILAGGSGTRFWPLSRNDRPKQLLRLFDDETLIEKTVNRLSGLVPLENILVLTNETQEEAVRRTLPHLPTENIVAEPARRDTAPAIALATGWIAARDPEAAMIVLPADQLITNVTDFQHILDSAVQVAEKSDAIVTLGIRPDWPCPEYGYIERGDPMEISGMKIDHPLTEVKRFREKPGRDTAERFLEEGNFSWNAGIFIWSIPTLIRELEKQRPDLAEFVHHLKKSRDFSATVRERFASLEKNSIDYAILENAQQVCNIEADVGWDDVGGWPSLGKYLDKDGQGNAVRGDVMAKESKDNIVFNSGVGQKIALLGVHDLIVVRTEDSILVADRHQAAKIKVLVEELPDDVR